MAIKIAVYGLSATPVIAALLDPAARNARLGATVLERCLLHPSIHLADAAGWCSARNCGAQGGLEADEVLGFARPVAGKLSAERSGKPVSPRWTTQAGAHVNAAEGATIAHHHAGSVWSGAYSVNDGGGADDPALGGAFEMTDPLGPGPAMDASTLPFAGEGSQSADSETLQPKPGRRLSSWLMRQVRPYRGTGLRVPLAFRLGLDTGLARA